MDWNNHMMLPEQAACGMLDACETLEPAQIARLAHPRDEQAFDRTRQLLLGAIEAGDLLALGVVCDLKAQARIKERPVNYAVTTLSEWSMRDEQHRQSAEMVLQRMRALESMGCVPTLPPAHGEGWLPSDLWPNARDPHDVLRRVCACDPHRIAPERVLLIDHQLSQRDIPRDSLRNFIAGAPPLVQRQLFPQNSPLWQWLGQEPTHAAALSAAGASIERTAGVVNQSPETAHKSRSVNSLPSSAIEWRLDEIVEDLKARGLDLHALPTGTKKSVFESLSQKFPGKFATGNGGTFDKAWQKGLNEGRYRLAEHATFSGKTK